MAWSSLGVAALAGGAATIETRVGALEAPVTIRIEEATLIDSDYVVHFPIPMHRAWDNVIYTCSVMLLFQSEAQVDDWCAARGVAKGDVRPLEQIWRFAADWYGRHASPTWIKGTVPQAIARFATHHLTGPTWRLADRDERFWCLLLRDLLLPQHRLGDHEHHARNDNKIHEGAEDEPHLDLRRASRPSRIA